MGVVFFIYNAAFALILLLMVLVSSVMALISKNPDTRYQPMRDDRGSFIKSQTQLNTELDALGATARGEGKTGYRGRSSIDGEDDSYSSASAGHTSYNKEGQSQYYDPPRSPGHPPSHTSFGNPPSYHGRSESPYGSGGSRPNSGFRQQNNASPAGGNRWQVGAGYGSGGY
jgi:hypothetical protein